MVRDDTSPNAPQPGQRTTRGSCAHAPHGRRLSQSHCWVGLAVGKVRALILGALAQDLGQPKYTFQSTYEDLARKEYIFQSTCEDLALERCAGAGFESGRNRQNLPNFARYQHSTRVDGNKFATQGQVGSHFDSPNPIVSGAAFALPSLYSQFIVLRAFDIIT